MKSAIIALALVITACGTEEQETKPGRAIPARGTIEAFFQPLADMFADRLGRSVQTPIVWSSETPAFAAAECYGHQAVFVSESLKGKPLKVMEQTIFHELGHCELGLSDRFDTVLLQNNIHDSRVYGDEEPRDDPDYLIAETYIPASIMHHKQLMTDTYYDNHDYYMTEMFGAALAYQVVEQEKIGEEKTRYTLVKDHIIVLVTESKAEFSAFIEQWNHSHN